MHKIISQNLKKEWLESDKIQNLESDINCRHKLKDLDTRETQNAVVFEKRIDSEMKHFEDENHDVRRSKRETRIPERLEYQKLGGITTRSLSLRLFRKVANGMGDYNYLMGLITDHDS